MRDARDLHPPQDDGEHVGGTDSEGASSQSNRIHPWMIHIACTSTDMLVMLIDSFHDATTLAGEALSVLASEIVCIASSQIMADEALCAAFERSCSTHAMMICNTRNESAIARFAARLTLMATKRLSHEWRVVLQRWRDGGIHGVSTTRHLAVIFMYTINMPPVHILLNLDARMAAARGRRAHLLTICELLHRALLELPPELPTNPDTRLFRGMDDAERRAWFTGADICHVVSCSRNKDVAQRFGEHVLTVGFNRGVHAVSLASLTAAHPREAEVVVVPTAGLCVQPYVDNPHTQSLSRLDFWVPSRLLPTSDDDGCGRGKRVRRAPALFADVDFARRAPLEFDADEAPEGVGSDDSRPSSPLPAVADAPTSGDRTCHGLVSALWDANGGRMAVAATLRALPSHYTLNYVRKVCTDVGKTYAVGCKSEEDKAIMFRVYAAGPPPTISTTHRQPEIASPPCPFRPFSLRDDQRKAVAWYGIMTGQVFQWAGTLQVATVEECDEVKAALDGFHNEHKPYDKWVRRYPWSSEGGLRVR